MGSDHPQSAIAHAVQLVVVGDVARADHFDARFVQTTLQKLLHDRSTIAGRDKDKQGIGFFIPHFLQERREIGVAQRHAQAVNDLPAIEGESLFEILFAIQARTVVGNQGDHLFDAIFRGPIGHGDGHLRDGKA